MSRSHEVFKPPAWLGGLLSGIAFEGIGGGGLNYSANNLSGWNIFGGGATDSDVNGQPYGHFNFGAGTGPNFQGGAGGGIAIGSTINLVFNVTGSSATLATLDAASFFNLNADGYYGVIRFNSFDNEGSDKVPIVLETVVVPVPAPMLLAAGGLMVGALVRRRMK